MFRQSAAMALVSGLGAARFGILAPRLLIARGRLRRGPRGLGRALKFQHQLHQLLFAQAFKIIAIHQAIDSEIDGLRKGVSNYKKSAIGRNSLKRKTLPQGAKSRSLSIRSQKPPRNE
jgi:hypothetical protein